MHRLLILLSLLVSPAWAQEPLPDAAEVSVPLAVAPDPAVIERSLQQLLASWNTPELRAWLAEDFGQREQLLNYLLYDAPPSARLQLVSVGPVIVLEQEPIEDGVVSVVSVTARVQLLFEDAELGFQRREGTGRYVLRLAQRVPK